MPAVKSSMNGDRIFVDTNILVYGHDVDSGPKNHAARRILMELWQEKQGVLSTQVLQEFYVTMTRKVARPLPRKAVRDILRDYFRWPVERIDPETILNASRIEESYRISFWDALIVAAASQAAASKILTEDLKSGQTLEGILLENPFL
jgi:predicted nucleic acid-binding protein